jgi:hypothetical protein
MPENCVSVTRPGKFGNPFVGEGAVEKYRECILNNAMVFFYLGVNVTATQTFEHFKWISENLHLLKGKNLACFCPGGSVCHADVLIELCSKL